MQDTGRSIGEATRCLIKEYPRYRAEITAFYERWDEMFPGAIEGTVEILQQLHAANNVHLYALTNWPSEVFHPFALDTFDFLKLFEGIVVSGEEKIAKPNPEIYHVLFERYNVAPSKALFIDDSLPNIKTAEAIGMQTIHFHSPEELKKELQAMNLLAGQA